MDFSKIIIIIEQNRALTEMSSLPFIIGENGSKRLIWFNYTIEPYAENMIGHVRKLFLVDENMNVIKSDISINVNISDAECDEPKWDEDKYMEILSRDYKTIDYKTNMNYLKEAVLEIFVPVYEAVFSEILERGENYGFKS